MSRREFMGWLEFLSGDAREDEAVIDINATSREELARAFR